MKPHQIVQTILIVVLCSIFAQGQGTPVKRTVTKTDRFAFGAGGTVVIVGAPNGKITVESWPQNEIEVNAEINFTAPVEADVAKLAELIGFVTEESAMRATITSIGPHNKYGAKKLPKNFNKSWLLVPFTVDYVIKVPRYADLQIDGGRGDLSITGVEGSFRVNVLESAATVEVVGGDTLIMIGSGSADVSFGTRGWRGRTANVQVGTGDLTLRLPSTMSAEIDASVLRTGHIENGLADLRPRDRKVPFSKKSLIAKAGAGGVPLRFTVGDGTMKLVRLSTTLP